LKPVLPQIQENTGSYFQDNKLDAVANPGKCLNNAKLLAHNVGSIPPLFSAQNVDPILHGFSLSSRITDDNPLCNTNGVSFRNNNLQSIKSRNEKSRKSKKVKISTTSMQAISLSSPAVVTPNMIVPKTFVSKPLLNAVGSGNDFTVKSNWAKPPLNYTATSTTLPHTLAGKSTPVNASKVTTEPNRENTNPYSNRTSFTHEALRQEKKVSPPLPQYDGTAKRSCKKLKSRKVYTCKLCHVPLKGHRCLKVQQSQGTLHKDSLSNHHHQQQQHTNHYQSGVHANTNNTLLTNFVPVFPTRDSTQLTGILPSTTQASRRKKKKSTIQSIVNPIQRNPNLVLTPFVGASPTSNHLQNPTSSFVLGSQSIVKDGNFKEFNCQESSKNGLLDVLAAAAAMDVSSSQGHVDLHHRHDGSKENLPNSDRKHPVSLPFVDLIPLMVEKQPNSLKKRSRSPSLEDLEGKIIGLNATSEGYTKPYISETTEDVLPSTNRDLLISRDHIENKDACDSIFELERVELWPNKYAEEYNDEAIDIILENYKMEQFHSQLQKNEKHEHRLLLLLQNKLAY
jgi:hypothetical protein